MEPSGRRLKTEHSFSNILIRVPNWLGDTMMALPAVASVKRTLPKSNVTVLCQPIYRDLWKAQPGVDDVLTLGKGFSGSRACVEELRSRGFDSAILLPTSLSSAFLAFAAGIPCRSGWGGEAREFFLTDVIDRPCPRQRHLVLEYLDLVHRSLGVPLPKGRPIGLAAQVTPVARKALRKVWEDTDVREGRGFLALSAGATYGPAKRWPLPYWKELITRLLLERKESLLLLGGIEEEAYLRPLMGIEGGEGRLHLLAGRTSPEILVAMLSRCKLLITNDTGPMHAAAAAGTPTVALFGSTSPLWTRPFGKGHEVLHKRIECSPCFQRTCPIGYKCLNAITVEEVLSASRRALRGIGRVGPERIPFPLGVPSRGLGD